VTSGARAPRGAPGVGLHTGGYCGARGEDVAREFDRLRQAASGGTAQELAARVIAEVERFAQGAPQHDDITVLAARCMG